MTYLLELLITDILEKCNIFKHFKDILYGTDLDTLLYAELKLTIFDK